METIVYITACSLVLLPFFVLGGSPIVINEVFYDPPGADDGYEFIEIVNVSDKPICLSGWILESGNGAYKDRWRLEWRGNPVDTIYPWQFIVIGERLVTPPPDFICDLDIQNGPDGCRIRGPSGEIDVVGWGELDYECYYEGQPSIDVGSGWSLGRDPDGFDTDNNSSDLVGFKSPTPGDYNHPPFDLELESLWVLRDGRSPSESIRAVCSIRNVGTRCFGSGARVFLGSEGVLVEEMLSTDIEPSQTTNLVVQLPKPSPGRHLLTGRVVHDLDRWHSNDSLVTSFVIDPPPLVINEIMFCPPEDECEWIEVYCRQGILDLAGWTIEESTRKRVEIAASSLEIATGELLVIVQDKQAFEAKYGQEGLIVVKPQETWQSLNDADGWFGFADYVVIRDRFGTLIDSVAYSGSWSKCGISLERVSLDQPSWDQANWSQHYGTKPGSPGRVNSVSVFEFNQQGILAISPNVFSPDKDGSKDLLSIKITLPEPSKIWVGIYDLNGYEIATLLDGSLVQSGRITFWDGNDSEKRRVPTGVYIVSLRASGHNGEYREIKPVVLFRRSSR